MNNEDDLDIKLREYLKQEIPNEIPPNIQNIINKSCKKIERKNNINYKLSRVAIFILSLGILGTSVVFAKDIISFISSIFTNSTPAIEKAAENGYIQNLDMDYVYSNDIGVKVEALVVDDFNLDISFVYKIESKDIKEIKLEEYIILTENNDLIYDSTHSVDNKLNISNGVTRTGQPIKVDDITYKESILFNLIKTKNNILSININIKKLKIKKEDDSIHYIDGNWNFNIKLDENMINSKNIVYNVINDNNIDEIQAEMTATEFVIKVKLNIPISLNQFYDNNNFILENNISKKFVPYYIENGYIDSNNMEVGFFTIHYDNINKYMENIDKLKLNINIDEKEIYTITLFKKLVE